MPDRELLEQNMLRRQAVGDYLHRNAARIPDKTAFVFQEKRFSYREFDAAVNRAAHALSSLGLGKGDVLAIMSQNCHQMAIFMWACFKTGVWYSPINYLLRNEEIIYQINHSEAKAFFVESALVDEVTRVMGRLPTVEQYGLITCLEVEEVLNRHQDVEISAVFSAPHPYWVEGVAAVVVPRKDSLDAEGIAEYAKKNLAGYKLPKKIVMLKSSDLPVSPTGKILKRELRERYKDICEGEKGK